MKISLSEIENLLPGYFTGDLSVEDRAIVDDWRRATAENEKFFCESLEAWESLPLLQEMEQFNSFEALKKVNTKIALRESESWWVGFQRIAAVILLPLMVYSGYLTYERMGQNEEEKEIVQTVTSRQGMVSQFTLADGTKVWLNSGSQLEFPNQFSGSTREVKLTGEAFFEVTKNPGQPFRVNAKELNVEVLGTSFNVVSYPEDNQSEVVLVTGKVGLKAQRGQIIKDYGVIHPGQRAVYNEKDQKVYSENVNTDKYIAWREGNLIFRDDTMDEVVKRLSRWYNVEIVINDPEIKGYIYKATFRNENLEQVLNLLKISAPIDYRITNSKILSNGEFSKPKVYLMKRKS